MCDGLTCTCCRTAYIDGLFDGLRVGYRLGHYDGYVGGYLDGHAGNSPLPLLPVMSIRALPMHETTIDREPWMPPTAPLLKRLPCGCDGVCLKSHPTFTLPTAASHSSAERTRWDVTKSGYLPCGCLGFCQYKNWPVHP